MKVDFDKCHLLLSTTEAFNFQIPESVIYNSLSRKLLGVTSQQTFAGLRDVLKTSSRYVLKTYSTRLQRNNFSSPKTSWRRLGRQKIVTLKTSRRLIEDMPWRRPEDMSRKHLQDVLKTKQMGISVSHNSKCVYI